MKTNVTIAGQPVVDIYECQDARCWYVTRKVREQGHWFLYGYVRCFEPALLAEFQHVPEEALLGMDSRMWRVPQEVWHRCPLVAVEESSGLKVVCCQGEEGEGQPSPSCSE